MVQTKTQPIAIDDALINLVGVLGRPGTIGEMYDIGGRRLIVAVPLPSPMSFAESAANALAAR